MFILYTDQKDGEWIPWNTPHTDDEIRLGVEETDFVVWDRDKETFFFCPPTDNLPIFHSILLFTAARWDAFNKTWTSYMPSKQFEEFWYGYISHYKPGETHPHYWWLDQGPAWSIHGINKNMSTQ